MRKPVFQRIILITLLYCFIFLLLASMQFAKRGAFRENIAGILVSGHYRMTDEGIATAADNPNERFLDGEVLVVFGGLEFSLANKKDGQSLRLTGDGWSAEALPESMTVYDDAVSFGFPDGTALVFTILRSGASVDLRISGVFPEEADDDLPVDVSLLTNGIELPFALQRRTGVQGSGDGQFTVNADGVSYTLGSSPIDSIRRVLLVTAGGEPVSYSTLGEVKVFTPDDFVLRGAESADAYNAAIARWVDQNFSLWSRIISGQNNEDIVVALAGEAINRGSYRTAVNAVSLAFMNGPNRTWESSVFLGGLDSAHRALINAERTKLANLSRLISEKSLEFLLEPHVFEYFGVRGRRDLIDAGADLIDTIDAGVLALDIIPGILEGYTDWGKFSDDINNPFERLVNPACIVISEYLTRTDSQGEFGGLVFLHAYGMEDYGFNLRLGKALLNCAEAVGSTSWAGVGRSLVLTALYGTGEDYDSGHSELANAKLYRVLAPADSYPRAVTILPQPANIWAWTTAPALSVTQQGNLLDIAVTFPVGETHFMIIRGVPSFTRIQLYNIDFRTDPQFERYDSSGWSYNSQEQTLILKMQHRSQVENIRIYFGN